MTFKNSRWFVFFSVLTGVLMEAAPFDRPAARADELSQQVLFKSGTGPYYGYRIPALAVSNAGTVLAFAEGRYGSIVDTTITDLVLRRSIDNGQTWNDIQVIVPGLGVHNYNSATPVVDRTTGQIIVTYAEDQGITWVTKSDDDGLTWSAPENITPQIKNPAWAWHTPGPAGAIQLSSGRLIVPSYHREALYTNYVSTANAFYSDDHGVTWQSSEDIEALWANEGALVELTDGRVAMITRIREGLTARHVGYSDDGGHTWDPASMTTQLGVVNVQGSVERLSDNVTGDANRILYASPAGSNDREMMTVSTSYDETQSWVNPRVVYWGNSAYSDLAISPDGQINLLYERGRANSGGQANLYQEITLAQFSQEWLEGPARERLVYNFAEQAPGVTATSLDGNIRDAGGWDLHGQALGNPQYVAGADGGDGRALRFTAGADRILLDRDDSNRFFYLDANQSFSIEAVFRTTSHTAGGIAGSGALISSGDSLTESFWSLQVESGTVQLRLRDVALRTRRYSADLPVTDGEWYHVVAVRDTLERLFKLYINDQLVGVFDDDIASLFNNDDVYVGQWADGTRSFVGDIDSIGFLRSVYVPVPEPSTMVLGAMALAVFGHLARRRRAVGR